MNKDFLDWANKNNWKIRVTDEIFTLPNTVTERYSVSNDWLDFIKGIEICTNNEQNKWFITISDYSTKYDENSWNWNDFEIMSLNAAEDDLEWQDEIKEFWNTHFPIFIDVEGDYSYYAIDTDSGEIVQGYEPDFEDCFTVAETFEEFISKIIFDEIIL